MPLHVLYSLNYTKLIQWSSFAIALGWVIVTNLIVPATQANTHTKTDANPFLLTKSSTSSDVQTAKSDLEKDRAMKMKDSACGEGKCAGNKVMPKMNKNKKGEGW